MTFCLGRVRRGFSCLHPLCWASLVAQTVKNLPAMWETWIWSLGLEDPLEGGYGNRLLHSRLENSMDRGAWWATVHRVTESQTRLSNWEHIIISSCFSLVLHLLAFPIKCALWNLGKAWKTKVFLQTRGRQRTWRRPPLCHVKTQELSYSQTRKSAH